MKYEDKREMSDLEVLIKMRIRAAKFLVGVMFFLTVINYLAVSFVEWDFIPGKWSMQARCVAGVIFFISEVAAVINMATEK